ncbi:MAG: PstS family phosphate ABC transporter substrate-binding protein [Bacteroidetes bacterium]|nr:PstS family phosphate ABC transporter substrate-binding protein [Bacteroidota bacterium]
MTHYYLLLALSITLIGCKEEPKPQDPELAAIIKRNTIIIKGSDTELPMVKDFCQSYKKEHAEILFDLSGGGSGIGIEALINNETDIANSSREMKPSEIERAKKNGVNPIPVMFSVDALAIITHSKLGVDSLSTEQLTQIFSGEITNWKDLGGPDLSIVVYGRDSTSGTYSYLKDKFIRAPYAATMKHLSGNAEIVKAVQTNIAAIGYAGVGFLMDENGKPNGSIWAMPIYIKGSRAYSPYEVTAVKKGDYVLTRPLYQYINGKPSTQIYDFIMSELTLKGQEIIKTHGYFPINDYQAEINKLNGL